MLTQHQSIHSHHFKTNNPDLLKMLDRISIPGINPVFYQFMEDNKLMGYWKSSLARFHEDWSTIKCKGTYLTFAWDDAANKAVCFWSNDMENPVPDTDVVSEVSQTHNCTCDLQQLVWGNGCTCKGM